MTAMALYQEAMRKFQGGRSLGRDGSRAADRAILDRQLSEVQVAALLAGLAVKGEVASEIAGFARGMRRVALTLEHRQQRLVDTAGTGGDGAGTFNISTAAAFVIAGAGVPVAKHGNRAISGQCGSADVLARLGVRIDAPREVLKTCLATCGITFLFAPVFHQAMKVVGPLPPQSGHADHIQPVGALAQSSRCPPADHRGVCSPSHRGFAQVLKSLGCEHALIFSGEDGLDEISIAGPTRVTELRQGAIGTDRLRPQDLGFQSRSLDQVQGEMPRRNAGILRGILAGEGSGAQRDIVLMNAAAAFMCPAHGFAAAAVEVARKALDEGRALARLEAWWSVPTHDVRSDPVRNAGYRGDRCRRTS